MSVIKKLIKVQDQLKAPKNQYNDFGGYNYRSCEDIVEAVKPLLHAEGLLMTISDELVQRDSRYYIKATVKVTDGEESVVVDGWAREAENKKRMDPSQITGASSSYARKYALNGMFAIDDTKDADDLNKHGEGNNKKDKPNNNKSKSNGSKNCQAQGCSKKVSEKVVKYCKANQDIFDGYVFCRNHQEKYKNRK